MATNQKIIISSNEIKMSDENIQDVFNKIEKKFKNKFYRHIGVNIDENGNKIPIGEKNNMTLEEIKEKRGNYDENTLSLYLKHIQNLYVVDFDTKKLEGCELKSFLDNELVSYTETNKGFHYYLYLNNMIAYTNQQKIYKTSNFEIDLIKNNNIWETKGRKLYRGYDNIKTFEWEDMKKYFNIKKMKNVISPSPFTFLSSKTTPVPVEFKMNLKELEKIKKAVNNLNKSRVDNYKEWLDIGMALYNGGDNMNGETLKIWDEFSKSGKTYDYNSIIQKWAGFLPKDNGLKINSIFYWSKLDNPENKYSEWYSESENLFMENMNKECMYYTQEGTIFYYSNDILIKNKKDKANDYYKKLSFNISQGEGKPMKKVNPFEIWLSNIKRRDIDKIVFEPNGKEKWNEINTWKGFKIKNTGKCNIELIQHVLDHIKNILADGDEERHEYILNWISRILQTPENKNGICLAFQSIEGVGKTIIMDLLEKIMGENYCISTSSLEKILGKFNKLAENKILINLNETNWGGNKKMVGPFKTFITDLTISIENKGFDSYTIRNLSNCMITTNEEWIADVNGDDRRFNFMKCSSKKYKKEYYEKIADTNIQELANFFYNKDISNFNPKEFVKSELNNEQVEINMDSVEQFIYNIVNREIEVNFGADDDDIEFEVSKSSIFDSYRENTSGDFNHKFNNVHFWKKFKKILPTPLIKKSKKKGDIPKVVFNSFNSIKSDFQKYTGRSDSK